MRINTVLVSLSLSLFAACTDDTSTAIDTARPGVDIAQADQPSTLKMSQSEAEALCPPHAYLPNSLDIQAQLGDCVASSIGWICAPLSVHADQATVGKLEQAPVWTSSTCELPTKEEAFFVADLETGEVTCRPATAALARPLCLR